MPLVDFDDPRLWDGGPDSLYRSYRLGDAPVGYIRAVREEYRFVQLPDIVEALKAKGFNTGSRIVISGGGFGWMAEDLNDLGYRHIVNVETSKWIHANSAANARLPILNEHLRTSASRSRVRKIAGPVDWCISEDIMPCLTDLEALDFAKSLRSLAPNVLHIVSVKQGDNQDVRLNWKSAEQWKALLSPDFVVSRSAAVVL